MDKEQIELSKHLSFLLRHHPEAAGLSLDENGWADVSALIAAVRSSGRAIDFALLGKIVHEDEKGRYAFSKDGTKIRAVQGHSFRVDVGLKESMPPEFLYHGTSLRASDAILREGLKKMSRLYVHLSETVGGAERVAARRKGNPVILMIRAGDMSADGYLFFLSENGVWLTDHVPPCYIEKL